MTKERLLKLKEDAEIMLIRMEHNPALRPIYRDVKFRRLIEDINVYLNQFNNQKEEVPEDGFIEPTPEELAEIPFMIS